MVVEEGDLLAITYPPKNGQNEVYRIEKAAMEGTYSRIL
jgi:hypothetical protein